MASLVARAAAAAASLPSGRAGLLGSGRLPLPRHGALVLAGRRVGVGRGGVLALQFMVGLFDFCGDFWAGSVCTAGFYALRLPCSSSFFFVLL